MRKYVNYGRGPTSRKSVYGRFPQLFFILVICLSAAACYGTKKEVIPPELGEVLPYTSSSADLGEGRSVSFSRVGSSKDYRFRLEEKGEQPRTGTFRAMRIKGDIYAVQSQSDGDDDYNIEFYRITANVCEPAFVDPAGFDVEALARRHSVELNEDQDYLHGNPRDILAFLKAHKDVKFLTKE